MKVTFLGTGTSMGTPLINCTCAVCRSSDPRDHRTRCSVKIETGTHTLLIDASSDFRQQALRFNIPTIDGIFITHPHADHVFGLDDTRIFSVREKRPIPLFATEFTLDNLRHIFSYAFEASRDERLIKPAFQMNPLKDRQVIYDMKVTCIHAQHGDMAVTGYRMNDFAYLTDFSHIESDELDKLMGVKFLVLGALRYTPSISHLTVSQALELLEQIHPEQAWLTHFSHEISHSKLSLSLPENVNAAYDGLTLEC